MSLRLPSIESSDAEGSVILHETARQYEWSGTAPFSLKWFPAGTAHYEVGGAEVRLDRARILLVGQSVDYRIRIDGDQDTESLCLFFEPALVTDVLRNVNTSHETLLDDPSHQRSLVPGDLVRTWPVDGVIGRHLGELRHLLSQEEAEPSLALELVSDVLLEVSRFGARAAREIEQLSAVKRSTRRELYRRLHLAREFIRSSFAEPLKVPDVARASMLSPTHLNRNFRALFGETPRQFLIRTRLREARTLLGRTEMTVTEVCFAVGYESVGSFSRLYKCAFGMSPGDERSRRQGTRGLTSAP